MRRRWFLFSSCTSPAATKVAKPGHDIDELLRQSVDDFEEELAPSTVQQTAYTSRPVTVSTASASTRTTPIPTPPHIPTPPVTMARDNFVARVTAAAANLRAKKSIEYDSTTLDDPILQKCFDIALDPETLKLLEDLQPGQGMYLQRDPKDPKQRSLSIVRGLDGEFILLLESKSKFFSGLKRVINWPFGAYREWKVTYRVDVLPIEVWRSGTLLMQKKGAKPPDTTELNKQIAESSESAQVLNALYAASPRHFLQNFAFLDQNGKLRLYAPNGGRDLFSILQEHRKYDLNRELIDFDGTKIEAWRVDLIYQIAQALAGLEKARINHNDLKIENMVCTYDPQNKKFNVKIIDPKATSFDNPNIPHTTPEITAPEGVWQRYHEYNESMGDSAASKNKREVAMFFRLNRRNLTSVGMVEDLLKEDNFSVPEFKDPAVLAGKQDMWSFGNTILEILLDQQPKNINQSVVDYYQSKLHGFPFTQILERDPAKRITATDLLLVLDKMPQFAKAKETYSGQSAQLQTVAEDAQYHNIPDAQPVLTSIAEFAKSPSDNRSDYNSLTQEVYSYAVEFFTNLNEQSSRLLKEVSLDLEELGLDIGNIVLTPLNQIEQAANYKKSTTIKNILSEINVKIQELSSRQQYLIDSKTRINDEDLMKILNVECALHMMKGMLEMLKVKYDPDTTQENKNAKIDQIVSNTDAECRYRAKAITFNQEHGSYHTRYGG